MDPSYLIKYSDTVVFSKLTGDKSKSYFISIVDHYGNKEG